MCFESQKMYTFGNMGKFPSKAQTKLKKLFYLGDSVTPTREWEISAVSWRFSHNLGAEWHIYKVNLYIFTSIIVIDVNVRGVYL